MAVFRMIHAIQIGSASPVSIRVAGLDNVSMRGAL
jgi:hypothetical protein